MLTFPMILSPAFTYPGLSYLSMRIQHPSALSPSRPPAHARAHAPPLSLSPACSPVAPPELLVPFPLLTPRMKTARLVSHPPCPLTGPSWANNLSRSNHTCLAQATSCRSLCISRSERSGSYGSCLPDAIFSASDFPLCSLRNPATGGCLHHPLPNSGSTTAPRKPERGVYWAATRAPTPTQI